MTNTLKDAALSAPRVEPVAWCDMSDAWKHRKILGIDKDGNQFVMKWKIQEKPHHDKEGWFEQIYRREPVAWMPLPGELAAPPSQPDTPARRQADIVTGAMAIARSRGHDPEEPAPLTEMCTEDNAPVPWWMVFVEESEACLKAVSYAAQPDTGVREALERIINVPIGYQAASQMAAIARKALAAQAGTSRPYSFTRRKL